MRAGDSQTCQPDVFINLCFLIDVNVILRITLVFYIKLIKQLSAVRLIIQALPLRNMPYYVRQTWKILYAVKKELALLRRAKYDGCSETEI